MTKIIIKYKITTVTVSTQQMLKKCVTMEVLKSKINSCYCVTGLKFLSRNLFACLQDVISSFRLLSEAKSGLQIIKYFSHRHKLQRFEAGLYGAACFRIVHILDFIMQFRLNY